MKHTHICHSRTLTCNHTHARMHAHTPTDTRARARTGTSSETSQPLNVLSNLAVGHARLKWGRGRSSQGCYG